ncbi:MAG TPA: carboxy terminal-processing peptidase, partial [Gammaproteobacteria bacterium]|nr:carboxy terminal-processing peptidase [Gammaproteobacteria bacterium]
KSPSLLLAGALLAACIPAFATVTAPAPVTLAAPKSVEPDPRDGMMDQLIAGLLQRDHYSNRPLDETLSRQIFKHYLEDLDPNRSYFTQADVDSISGLKLTLGDDIKDGRVQPAFDIYNLFQKRVAERLQYALQLLSKEPDFTIKESYSFDRSKAPWAKDSAELDDLWRKRVKNDAIGLMLAGKTWPQAADTLRKRYQNFAYRTNQVNATDVFSLFMNSYVHSVDPHTDYFPPSQSEEFQIQMSLKLQGIGASLISDGEYTRVDHLLPGGPAARDKRLQPDDRITGVAQGADGDMVDVVGWRLDDVVALIRGTPGTVVRLQVLPAGAAPGAPEKVIQLTRDNVKLEAQAAHKKIVIVTRGERRYKIGVITVPGFYEDLEARMQGDKNYISTTRDVAKLLAELKAQHVDGVVMDLRNNGGGSLREAEDLTGLFIPEGPVVQIRHHNGKIDVEGEDADDGVVYAGPLAVLVNRYTASASEIFAAAIQDYRRGAVVGSTTYGKGTVQGLEDLNRYIPGDSDSGQLKITIDKFYRVSGSSTQNKGVTPDIILPALVDPTDVGESTNDSALPWDEIAPADYSVLHDGLEKALPLLNKDHEERVAKDPDWKLFMDALHEVQAERAETSVSLVLAERQKERSADDAKRLSLANAWRKLEGLPAAATLAEALKTSKTGASDPDGADDPGIEPDVLLDETAQVVADMDARKLFPPTPPSALADRN